MFPPVRSESYPINTGKNAPPTIAITSKDEAILEAAPNPAIPNAKMVGNMIDIKKGTAITAYTAMGPETKDASNNNTTHMEE